MRYLGQLVAHSLRILVDGHADAERVERLFVPAKRRQNDPPPIVSLNMRKCNVTREMYGLYKTEYVATRERLNLNLKSRRARARNVTSRDNTLDRLYGARRRRSCVFSPCPSPAAI